MSIPLCDQMTLTVTIPSLLGWLTKSHLEKTRLPAAKTAEFPKDTVFSERPLQEAWICFHL